MVDDFSFSLENLLDQAPTKRANTILYLIENRTAQSVSESQHVAQYVPYPVKPAPTGR